MQIPGAVTSLIAQPEKHVPDDCNSKPMFGIISWAPPQPNWNPWISCNIDDGPLALCSLSQISEDLQNDYQYKITTDEWKRIYEERKSLPVFVAERQVCDTIAANRVTLIRGQTGCGKTTQIPQLVLDQYVRSGNGAECSIVVTQPRRISAISIAERVAEERCEPLGITCGYSVRFESVLPRPYGSILYCTVGKDLSLMPSQLIL